MSSVTTANPHAVDMQARDDVEDDKTSQPEQTSFFSFADPGGYVWWAGGVLGALASCCLASIIIIAVNSSRRMDPFAAFEFLQESGCPPLSPLLPSVAFTDWHPTCHDATAGRARGCSSHVDCIMLSSECAPLSLLRMMDCGPERLGVALGQDGNRNVCRLGLSAAAQLELPNGGFCTTPGTRCAWCIDSLFCPSPTSCVPADECSSSSTWAC